MALLDIIYAAYIGVLITILIGIFVEGQEAQLDNVLSNIGSFVLILATTNMPNELIVALLVYLGLGVFIVARKIKDLYLLFGAKTYGSISLVMLVAENQFFGYVPQITFGDLRSMLIGCIVVGLVVHVIGFAYSHRRRGWGRRRARRSKTSSNRTVRRRKGR